MKIALAQLDSWVGDIVGNSDKIIAYARDAYAQGAKLVVFPELAICGYAPEDLLLQEDFFSKIETAVQAIKSAVPEIYILVGYPIKTAQGIYNSAGLFYQNKIICTYHKHDLPNYGVFDEKRYFTSGKDVAIVEIEKIKFGIIICEDIWTETAMAATVAAGAEAVLCLNASPYEENKYARRLKMLNERVKKFKVPIVYVNVASGQDDIIFDGRSLVINENNEICAQAKFVEPQLLLVDFHQKNMPAAKNIPAENKIAEIYQALVFSVREYVQKNNFNGVLLGLSGGIDSALTLCIAVDALGAEKVQAVVMPSRYTHPMSLEDAHAQTKALGVKDYEISIEAIFSAGLATLEEVFADMPQDITEENMQARARGMILMAMSNKWHKLVLTTGNKSELATGYCTLYGDMAGGFDVLKDVYKTQVFQLAKYRNQISAVIPERVITRPPSAELRHEQKDEDSLGSYDQLDKILKLYIEQNYSAQHIIEAGFDAAMVNKVIKLINVNEYKRRQAPIGPKVTVRAFGRDWRLPIAKK